MGGGQTLYASVARSSSSVRKLCTGKPSSVSLEASLAFAWSERRALATGDGRAARACSTYSDLIIEQRAKAMYRQAILGEPGGVLGFRLVRASRLGHR